MENFKYHPDRIKHIPGQEGPIIDQEKAHAMAEIMDGYHELADMYDEYLTRPDIFLETYPAVHPFVEKYRALEKQEEEFEKNRAEEQDHADRKIIFSIEIGAAKQPAPTDPKHEMAILGSDPEVAEYLEDPEAYMAGHPTTAAELGHFADMQQKGITGDYVRRIGEMAGEVKGAEEDYEAALMEKSTKEVKRDRMRAWKDLSLSAINALLNYKSGGHMDEHMDTNQTPDFYNALSNVRVALAIKNAAREELHNRRPNENYDYGKMEKAFDAFLPKFREFTKLPLSSVTEQQLDTVIDEIHDIELPGRGSAEIYGKLIDLRIAMFRPEMRSLLNKDETPEALWEKVKEAA